MFSISDRLEMVSPEWNCADSPSRNVRLNSPAAMMAHPMRRGGFLSIQESILSDSVDLLTRNGSESMPSSLDSGHARSSIDMEIDSDDEHV